MSWSTNDMYSRWEHLWTDEGFALCLAIIKEKDRLFIESTMVKAQSAQLKEILEPVWAVQKKKNKPAPKIAPKPAPKPQLVPKFRQPDRKPTPARPCCVGCKKFKVHPNPPPHFTPEDMAHCCAYCRVTNGTRHGEHCSRDKY